MQAASTPPAPFNVNITVVAACEVSTPPDLLIEYDPADTLDSVTRSPFTVTCTSGTNYVFDLDGTGFGAISSVAAPSVGLSYSLDIPPTGMGVGVSGGSADGTAQGYDIRALIGAGSTNAVIGNHVNAHTIAVTF